MKKYLVWIVCCILLVFSVTLVNAREWSSRRNIFNGRDYYNRQGYGTIKTIPNATTEGRNYYRHSLQPRRIYSTPNVLGRNYDNYRPSYYRSR